MMSGGFYTSPPHLTNDRQRALPASSRRCPLRRRTPRSYQLALGDVNLLTGKNNSGKSTIIGAFRILDVALRRSLKSFERLPRSGGAFGCLIPEHAIPISIENAIHNYEAELATVRFHFSGGQALKLVFDESGRCYLVIEAAGVRSNSDFRRVLPFKMVAIPHLGPIEHNEVLVERDTVMSNLTTHRASRNFRSYWYYFPEAFERFAAMVRDTWPGMEIEPPELVHGVKPMLRMYCRENRITREIFWLGVGFQIWCQLLTHISRASEVDLLVLDEPEIYLHPDIQRQLAGLLVGLGPQIIVATHSQELIQSVDLRDVLVINKNQSQ
jgi:hypothetical protein